MTCSVHASWGSHLKLRSDFIDFWTQYSSACAAWTTVRPDAARPDDEQHSGHQEGASHRNLLSEAGLLLLRYECYFAVSEAQCGSWPNRNRQASPKSNAYLGARVHMRMEMDTLHAEARKDVLRKRRRSKVVNRL
jgi:hypothetical protein